MLIHAHDPHHVLVQLDDLRAASPPARIAEHLAPLREVVAWAETYLCRSHPELGRGGPVCPYVQAAMRKGHFYLAVVPGSDLDPETVEARVVAFRDWFLELPPRDGEDDAGLKTILVLFPDVAPEDVPRLIDATQRRLKPLYVPKRLMIGEFHAGPPDKGGLWNADFRPLRSPVPMLVVRHMVPTDFAFLRDDEAFVRAYLDCYGDQVPAHLREEVRRVAEGFGIALPRRAALARVHPRVRAVLEEQEIEAVVHRHADLPQPQSGPEDVARALGYPLERITKSLFLRCRCHGAYVVVVAPVSKRVDLPLVAEHLGCRRLELASPQELSAWLGFSPGGVSPIASGGVPVVLDPDLFRFPTVLTAAGEVAVEIEVSPVDLQRVTRASVLAEADAERAAS